MHDQWNDGGDQRGSFDKESVYPEIYLSFAEMCVCFCEYAVRNRGGSGCDADSARTFPLDDATVLRPDDLFVYLCLRDRIDFVCLGGVFQRHSISVFRIYANLALSDADHLPGRNVAFHKICVCVEAEPDVLLHAHDAGCGDVWNVAGHQGAFIVSVFCVSGFDGGNHGF